MIFMQCLKDDKNDYVYSFNMNAWVSLFSLIDWDEINSIIESYHMDCDIRCNNDYCPICKDAPKYLRPDPRSRIAALIIIKNTLNLSEGQLIKLISNSTSFQLFAWFPQPFSSSGHVGINRAKYHFQRLLESAENYPNTIYKDIFTNKEEDEVSCNSLSKSVSSAVSIENTIGAAVIYEELLRVIISNKKAREYFARIVSEVALERGILPFFSARYAIDKFNRNPAKKKTKLLLALLTTFSLGSGSAVTGGYYLLPELISAYSHSLSATSYLTNITIDKEELAAFTHEVNFSKLLCNKWNGQAEYRTSDNSRVDCLTDEHSIEVDWGHKFHEGIGQALHYSAQTGRKPALVLIEKTRNFENHVTKAASTIRDQAPQILLLTMDKNQYELKPVK